MAEYAGLEIRIGGDTTKLTNALKAPTKSAADLASRIRQITRAMQFDPTNLQNVETRIRLTGDRMESLQSKTQIAKTAMQQLGDSMVKLDGRSKSVREVASETDNLSLKAKQADSRYGELTKTLGEIYEAWNKMSRSKGVDTLMDQLGFTQAEAEHLMSGATTLRDFTAELRREQELRSSLTYNGNKPVFSDADIENLEKFKKLNFHDMFKRGLDLDDVISDARELGIVIEDSAIKNVRELQKTFKDAQQEKKAYDDALKFEQLGNDIQRYESEVEGLSQTMRRLDDGMTATTSFRPFQNLESEIRKIDSALDNVEHDMQRTKEAMKVDPSNIQLAARYMQDLQQKAELSEQKATLLDRQMRMLDANGASKAAQEHQDLAKWIEESAEKARTANKALSDQKATVANLQDEVKRYEQNIANMKGDSTLASYSDNVLQWQKRTQQLAKEMENLSKAEQLVAEQGAKVGDAQSAFDKATSEVDEYKKKLEALKREYEELDEAYGKALNNPDVPLETQWDMYNRLKELPDAIRDVETAYEGAQTNAKLFNRELEDQQERASIAESSLSQQRDKVDELRQAVSNLEKTKDVRIFRNPTGEIEKAEGELVELRGELDRAIAKENELESAYDSAKTENELAKTAQAAREVSQKMEAAKAEYKKAADEMKLKDDSILNPSTVKSIGMTLSATLTPAITALGYKMVDASSTIDTAYRDMRKTVSGTEEQFETLKKNAIDFSRTHVTSADQILQIEAIGGELGVATENLESFAEAISNIDVATNLDAEGAAETLGHLANIMHLTENDYEGFSDALVRLGNNGASTETEIANIAERIGSMGTIVGMSKSDVLAWASTIASTGQNAEAAGTAISRTMSFFETAVSAAGGTLDTSFEAINAAVEEGGDKLTVFASLAGMTAEEFAESWETGAEDMATALDEQVDTAKDSLQLIADIAHMSADDFAKAWEEDPTVAMKAFIEGLNDVEKAGGSADKVLSDLGIRAVRQKQAIEGLMQTVGGLDDNLTMSKNAWEGVSDQWGEAGDAANEAAKKAEGFSGQLQIMKNMGQNFLSELGEGAVPWMKMFSGQISFLSQTFSTFSTDTKKWIVALGGLAAAAGPIMSVSASFATAKGEFMNWVDESVTGMAVVKAAFAKGGQEAVDSLLKSMSGMDKFKFVAASLGKTLLKGLAIGAVVGGIALIISELAKLYGRYKEHVAATKGLSDALAGVGKLTEITADGFDMANTSLRQLVEDSNGYEGRLANLTKTLEDSNRQYGTYAGQLDYYADTIANLSGKQKLTEDESYRLQAALQAVNDACGTTYGLDNYGNIIDTETGKIQKNTDVINANIEARKQQALLDYYNDDYMQAVGEHAEAQDKLNDAEAKYNDLISDSGRKKYFDDAKKVYGRNYDEAKIQAAYNKEVSDGEKAIKNYQTEVNKTGDTLRVLEDKMGRAREELNKANKVMEDAAKAEEERSKRRETVTSDVTGNMKRLSTAIKDMGASSKDFNLITDGLQAIHVSAEEMNDVDMSRLASSFSDVGGSMDQVIAALEDGGVQMNTWHAALDQVPEAAERMSSITAAAFQSMYSEAGNDLNATMTLIAGLDEIQVNDKTFYIGDNGSIIDSQGKIYDIEADLASIPTEVITAYYVDDAEALQTTLDAKANLEEVDGATANSTLNVTDNATAPADTLQSKLSVLNSTTANPTANLNDNASGGIDALKAKLSALDGSSATVTVTTVEKTVKQATGGMNNRPVIPRHATGYIATGPTLTNQGWIGEDGVEAVANWATGGAVVPLTNKKYMLPIADAIAEGMVARGAGGGMVNNYYVNDAIVNGDKEIQSAFLNLFDTLTRKGAMNVG